MTKPVTPLTVVLTRIGATEVDATGGIYGEPTFPYEALLVNPGAEAGNTSGWTTASGSFAAITSGGGNNPRTGSYIFRGGAASSYSAYQNFALPPWTLTAVDAGLIQAVQAGYHAGYTDNDSGRLELRFYDGVMAQIGSTVVSANWNDGVGTWVLRQQTAAVPAGTRTIRFYHAGTRSSGTNLDSYWDDFTLTLGYI